VVEVASPERVFIRKVIVEGSSMSRGREEWIAFPGEGLEAREGVSESPERERATDFAF